jgi:sensor histidine kinase YesM
MDYADYTFLNAMKGMLSSIADSHKYISSIYLYLDNYNNFFSSGDGVCYLDNYYDTAWYDTYKDMSEDSDMFINSRYLTTSKYKNPDKTITVYQRMTFANGVIVVNIDCSKFRTILSSMISDKDQNIYILNSEKDILLGYREANEEDVNFKTVLGTSDLPVHSWKSINGNPFLVTSSYYSDFGIYLVSITSPHALWAVIQPYIYIALIIFFIDCLLVFILSYQTTKNSFDQIYYVIDTLQNAENGIYPDQRKPVSNDEFGIIMTNVLKVFLNSTVLQNQLAEQRFEKEAAELTALQLQINPHFLFNTLQTINMDAMTQTGKPTSVNMMLDNLSGLLKYSLMSIDQPATLEEEVDSLKKYVAIQNFRFGDQFIMYYEIDDGLKNVNVMRLILQPIVENSIDHGIRPSMQKGFIKLKVFERNSFLHITVIDSGLGIQHDDLIKLRESVYNRNGTNIGLTNVNSRLVLQYGKSSCLRILSHYGFGTCVTFRIPVETH